MRHSTVQLKKAQCSQVQLSSTSYYLLRRNIIYHQTGGGEGRKGKKEKEGKGQPNIALDHNSVECNARQCSGLESILFAAIA